MRATWSGLLARRLLPIGLVAVVAPLAAALSPLDTLIAEPALPQADRGLQVSRDGSNWDDTLREPLFDPRISWVPGDVRRAGFLVRSTGAERGDLTVDVLGGTRNALRDNGYLAVQARADGGGWTSVTPGGSGRLIEVDGLDGGRPVPVELLVRLDPQAPNRSMVRSTDLELLVTISGDAQTLAALRADPQADSRTGALLASDSSLPPWLPPLGLLLIATGAALNVLGARRRTARHSAEAPPHVRTSA